MKNRKFVVIVNVQGQPFYYFYTTLLGAFICYAKKYRQSKKYRYCWVITLKENWTVNVDNDYEIKRR